MRHPSGDGQLDESLLRARDSDLGMDTEQKREARTHLLTPGWHPHPGADQPWHTNKGLMVGAGTAHLASAHIHI